MKSPQHVIDHPSQLNALTVVPFLRTPGLGTVRLEGSLADHPRREAWEAELNRHYYACGCDTSAKGLLLGLAAGGLWGLFSAGTTWTTAGWALGGALAGAAAGKVVGLLRAQSRLRAVVRDIQAHWKVEPPPEGVEAWTCG